MNKNLQHEYIIKTLKNYLIIKTIFFMNKMLYFYVPLNDVISLFWMIKNRIWDPTYRLKEYHI